MKQKLIIDGNAVYELDEQCMRAKYPEQNEKSKETAGVRQRERKDAPKKE